MIDALGGIRLNINTYIPIGGNTDLHIPPKEYLHPGPTRSSTAAAPSGTPGAATARTTSPGWTGSAA